MVIFNSYVKLPEGTAALLSVFSLFGGLCQVHLKMGCTEFDGIFCKKGNMVIDMMNHQI